MNAKTTTSVAVGCVWLVLAACTTDSRSVSAPMAKPAEGVASDVGSLTPAAPPSTIPGAEPDAGSGGVVPGPAAADGPPSPAATPPAGTPPAGTPPADMGCGDRVRAADEACDDGNTIDNDGCSADCLRAASGYFCEPGQPCIQVEICGDALLELGETCDDGNTLGGDGCAPSCRVERGYACPDIGLSCISTERCGDGLLTPREQCDDGNRTAGDGCTGTCQIEQGWYCPRLGPDACDPICGDGSALGRETCDDGNTQPGDGCFLCTVEPSPDLVIICGDGLLAPGEVCDSGINDGAYGGCRFDCTLAPRCGDGEVTAGFEECDGINNNSSYHNNPEACAPGCVRPWHCGDGVVDGTQGEACDDGINDGAYGGCTAQCLLAPRCGDGQVTADETCDDANRRDGDGCNILCRIERP